MKSMGSMFSNYTKKWNGLTAGLKLRNNSKHGVAVKSPVSTVLKLAWAKITLFLK